MEFAQKKTRERTVVIVGAGPGGLAASILLAAAGVRVQIIERLPIVGRFHRPLEMIVLHPIAITALLGIQWAGLVRFLLRKPTSWKSRAYGPAALVPRLTSNRVPAANA